MKKIFLYLGVVLFVALFSGCATMSLKTQSKMTRTIILDHSKNVDKKIYLQVINTADGGGEKMKLKENIAQKLEAKGYIIVPNSSEASYGLFINVLFANNLKEAYAIRAGLGYGTITGIASYASGNGGVEALGAGVLMAVGVGLVGAALEDEIFRAIIDISIRDYTENTIKEPKYKEHLSRVFTEAVQVNLKVDEALPILEEKASTQITNLF